MLSKPSINVGVNKGNSRTDSSNLVENEVEDSR